MAYVNGGEVYESYYEEYEETCVFGGRTYDPEHEEEVELYQKDFFAWLDRVDEEDMFFIEPMEEE